MDIISVQQSKRELDKLDAEYTRLEDKLSRFLNLRRKEIDEVQIKADRQKVTAQEAADDRKAEINRTWDDKIKATEKTRLAVGDKLEAAETAYSNTQTRASFKKPSYKGR